MPIRAGGAPLDPANVQALCASCHSRKTALSDGGIEIAQTGAGQITVSGSGVTLRLPSGKTAKTRL